MLKFWPFELHLYAKNRDLSAEKQRYWGVNFTLPRLNFFCGGGSHAKKLSSPPPPNFHFFGYFIKKRSEKIVRFLKLRLDLKLTTKPSVNFWLADPLPFFYSPDRRIRWPFNPILRDFQLILWNTYFYQFLEKSVRNSNKLYLGIKTVHQNIKSSILLNIKWDFGFVILGSRGI